MSERCVNMSDEQVLSKFRRILGSLYDDPFKGDLYPQVFRILKEEYVEPSMLDKSPLLPKIFDGIDWSQVRITNNLRRVNPYPLST